MTANKKSCPKCGDSCSVGAKFCGSCGYRFDEKSAGEVARKVQETVRSAESAVRTAESAVRTATKVRDLVITPPAEWNVVVGDRLPEALAAKAAGAVQAKATEVVVEKATEAAEEAISTAMKKVPAKPPIATESLGERCASCGTPLQPGSKFCGSCGAAYIPPEKKEVARPASTPAQGEQCPGCGAPLRPGMKFCGSCGAALTTTTKTVPLTGRCAACGAVLKPGSKFCGSCGAKVP